MRAWFEVGTQTRSAGSFTVTAANSGGQARAKWQWVRPDLGFFTGRSERERKGYQSVKVFVLNGQYFYLVQKSK